jgi:predicted exporter
MKKKNCLREKAADLLQKHAKLRPFCWLLPHLGVALLFLTLAAVRVDTGLFSLLPPSRIAPRIAAADRLLSEKQNSGMFVLTAHPRFDAAKDAALHLAGMLAAHGEVASAVSGVSPDTYREIEAFSHTWRYQLLSDETIDTMSRNPRLFADNAKAMAFMPFTIASLENLETDPFMLTETKMQEVLQDTMKKGTAMAPRDGVLWTEADGLHYVLVTATLNETSSLSGTLVPDLYRAERQLRETDSDLRFYNSGVQFHSYESSSNAQREITLIASISLAIVVLLLLYVFRSSVPLILALFSIGIAAGTAFCVTTLLFGKIHLLTLSFGTSLIGISIDYILHYNASVRLHTGEDRIFSRIALGLLTTIISYSILVFSQFPILRQMAVFSVTGLISVYISVVLLFPCFPAKTRNPDGWLFSLSTGILNRYSALARLPGKKKALIVLIAVAAAIPGFLRADFSNDIRGFYTMPPHLLEAEKKAADIIRHGGSGSYFIVEGDSAEDVLQKEEALTVRLQELAGEGALGSWMNTASFLPSKKQQQESREAFGTGLLPLAEEQYAALGFDPATARVLRAGWEKSESAFLDYEQFSRYGFSSLTSSLWIGSVEDRWYSAVLPLHVKNPGSLEDAAAELAGITFLNKQEEISASLTGISVSRLVSLFVAYCCIVLVLTLVFSFRRSLAISRAPLLSVLFTISILSYLGVPLNFFSVTAMVLVLGMGIDYSIFLENPKGERSISFYAVLLCMLTTVLSFGTLSLSSFAPVRTFGITLFAGILLSFIMAPLSTLTTQQKGSPDA